MTSEAASTCYHVLDWGEGRPTSDFRDDAQLTLPHPESPAPVEGG